MDDLFAHELLVVTGKGGVGKSTVAAALGLAACRRGLRTVVVEVAARGDIPRALAPEGGSVHGRGPSALTPAHVSIEPQRAMEEYLRQRLPLGALAGRLAHSRVFSGLTAATPGMRELLTMGKVWELARHDQQAGAPRYDLVVLDAPASGHALAMLQAPRTFASVARVGPIARQGGEIASFLEDSRRTTLVAVSSPEEMAVSETLALRSQLREALGIGLRLVVVNGVVRYRFTIADEQALRAAAHTPAQHAALFAANWARHQRAQVARARRGLPGVPLVTLPFVFRTALGRAALEKLSLRF